MKIGILTYHHVVNVGSVLQTYCAWRLISNLFPRSKVEVIDYYPEISREYNRKRRFQYKVSLKIDFEWIRLEKIYRNFLKNNCRFSKPVNDKNIDRVIRNIKNEGYDVIFVGSDTVFQMDGYFGQYIADSSAPNIYFLPGLTGVKKIGFSVSCDPVINNANNERLLLEAMPYLLDFDAILFRDASTESILHKINYPTDQMGYLPDPTIMIDFTHLIHSSKRKDNSPPQKIAGISIADSRIAEKIRSLVMEKGYVVCDVMQAPSGMHNSKSKPLGQRLLFYTVLDLLVTDRFHGSILGLHLGNYPIIGIENAEKYCSSNSKIRDLYTRINIEKKMMRCSPQKVSRGQFYDILNSSYPSHIEILKRFNELRLQGLENLSKLLNRQFNMAV